MAETQGNPFQAPDYALHRSGVTAVDGASITDRRRGINMAGNAQAHIQVVPSGTANPSVEVLWWSEAAGKFIPEHTALAKAGPGSNKSYEFTVDAKGRIMFVAMKTLTAGSVEIAVSGFNAERM